jgi:hypothetical protein
VSPVKSVSGRASASQVNESAPEPAGGLSLSAPWSARYQERAVVPGIGKLGHDCSNAGYGAPGCSGRPAPLSKRTRTEGSCWNAASAPV